MGSRPNEFQGYRQRAEERQSGEKFRLFRKSFNDANARGRCPAEADITVDGLDAILCTGCYSWSVDSKYVTMTQSSVDRVYTLPLINTEFFGDGEINTTGTVVCTFQVDYDVYGTHGVRALTWDVHDVADTTCTNTPDGTRYYSGLQLTYVPLTTFQDLRRGSPGSEFTPILSWRFTNEGGDSVMTAGRVGLTQINYNAFAAEFDFPIPRTFQYNQRTCGQYADVPLASQIRLQSYSSFTALNEYIGITRIGFADGTEIKLPHPGETVDIRRRLRRFLGRGAGDTVKSVLDWFGIKQKPGCRCPVIQAALNKYLPWGVA